MIKFLSCGWIILCSFTLFGKNKDLPHLKSGSWTGQLLLTETINLPFKLDILVNKSNYSFILYNGDEAIELKYIKTQDDSLYIEFPVFNSKLVLKTINKKQLSGYWQNLNKGLNYKIPCKIHAGYVNRFNYPALTSGKSKPSSFSGKWESTFEPGTPDAYKTVGLFCQENTILSGTFLTETGDYRFLEGNVINDSLYLSCFDGSHAFLFTGKLDKDFIVGNFYSGKHWQTDWTAFRNENFELTDPDSLTYIIDHSPVTFNLKDVNGYDFTFPAEQYKGKVTIIQIMGTWCPNCMDETRFFKEIYTKYHDQGLEIISIGYEVGSDFNEQAAKIRTLRERLDLDFVFLVGGTANKGLASEHFKMLNQIISFPTAIFIGKDGTVEKVHTGFNGPGTGNHYTEYVEETTLFIEELLKKD